MTQSSLIGTSFFGLDLTQITERLADFRRQVSRKVLLLEFTPSSLALAQISLSESEVSFSHISRIPLPDDAVERGVPADPLKMASLIKGVCKQEGIRARRTAVILPVEVVFNRLLYLPSTLSTEKAREFVVDPDSGLQIPIPISQTDFDLTPTILPHITEGSTEKKAFFLSCVPEKLVSQLIDTLRYSDLELSSIDLSFNCQLRLFSADIAGLEPGDLFLHLELNVDCTYLTIVGASGPLSISRLSAIREFSLPELSDAQAEAALAESIAGEALVLAGDQYMQISELDLRVLVGEVKEATREFSATLPYVVWKGVALAGVNSAHPRLEELLSDSLDLPVHIIRPLAATGVGKTSFRNVFVYQELGRLFGLGLRFIPHDSLVSCSLDERSDHYSFHIKGVSEREPIDVSLKDEIIYAPSSARLTTEDLSESSPSSVGSTDVVLKSDGLPQDSSSPFSNGLKLDVEDEVIEESVAEEEEEKEEEWPSLKLDVADEVIEESAAEEEEEKEESIITGPEAMLLNSLGKINNDFESLTVQELKRICLRNKLVGFKSLKKAALIDLLVSSNVPPPTVPIERLTKNQLIERIRRLTSE